MGKKIGKEFDMAIVYVRAIAIILIVYHHSIALFQGWPPVDLGISVPPFLSVSGHYAKFFGLYAFTLISGYLVGRFPSSDSYISFLIYKAKKILLPCIFAAVVYYLIFPNYMIAADPVNGTHLWYLPMIYILYMLRPILIDKITYKNAILLFFVYFGLWCGYRLIGYRFLIESFYYMGAFVLGAYLARIDNYVSVCNRQILILAFVLTVLLDTFINAFITIIIFVILFYLFLRTVKDLSSNRLVLMKILAVISRASMFIYISHQFIINYILDVYLKSHFSIILLPILSFGMSLVVPTAICLCYDRLK